ncbi:GntR family transcriptional regulator [Salicibibacter cibi]|uniref:GntR family transcriptional regulator n=1 Tax=Salicibibacter cibi TaxID=2743001 RepID=UPI001FE6EA1B|nr:GntR family transcriptional regulator [Salicibibacter cibi]
MQDLVFSQPLYQQLYESLKKSILTGEFQSGSKIIVTKLAAEYNISRTPMREALRQLQNEGLLVQDGPGLRVIELNIDDFKDLYDCRVALEKEVMKAVTNVADQELINRVEKLLDEADQALGNREYLQLLQLNTDFHDTLLKACPNKRAIQFVQQVRSLLLIYRAKILYNYDSNKEIINEHRQILESLKKGDVQDVIKQVESHLNNDVERGREVIDL